MAFDLFGWTIFGEKKTDEADVIGEPIDYEVTFEAEADRGLTKTLKGASSLWGDRKKPASGAAGLISKAKSDYKRLLAALYAEGRYGGTISIRIGGAEASGMQPDAAIGEPAPVTIIVDPGPVFTFDRTEIVNQAPYTDQRRDVVTDPAEEGFAAGEPARSGVILKAEKLATDAWRNQGYPKADIDNRKVVANHRDNTVDVVLTVAPGPRATYGAITVEGAERMNAAFVTRMSGLMEGDEYDPDDITAARDRLSKLDVFQSLKVEEGEIGPDGRMPLTIMVRERKPRRIGAGATYSTVDGGGLSAFWLHRNLFGRAERFRIEGRVAGLGDTVDATKFDYSVAATFTKPGTITPDTDFVASLIAKQEVLDNYKEQSVTGRAGFKHEFSDLLSGELSVEIKQARFEDVFGTRDFTTFALPGKLVYDGRDNESDPTEGFYAEITAEPFYEANFGNVGLKATAEARAYYNIDGDGRFVAAARARVGTLFGPPISQTPPDKLFFAGGGGSVRGYAYQGIGVTSGGIETGGRSLAEGSVELRAKVTESIGVVGFVDAGLVGAQSVPNSKGDFRVGAGGGVRYYTGLGPIRLDAAVPLNPGPGDPDFAVYVGIGQAF